MAPTATNATTLPSGTSTLHGTYANVAENRGRLNPVFMVPLAAARAPTGRAPPGRR